MLSAAAHGRDDNVPILRSPSWHRSRMTRGRITWWVGTALAAAAGLSFVAPQANASCAASHFSFGIPPLPFGEGFEQAKAPKPSEPKPAPCPCKGPHCHKAPAAPMSPPSAPTRSSPNQDCAWMESPLLRSHGIGAPFAQGNGFSVSLFFPSPLERPPR